MTAEAQGRHEGDEGGGGDERDDGGPADFGVSEAAENGEDAATDVVAQHVEGSGGSGIMDVVETGDPAGGRSVCRKEAADEYGEADEFRGDG